MSSIVEHFSTKPVSLEEEEYALQNSPL